MQSFADTKPNMSTHHEITHAPLKLKAPVPLSYEQAVEVYRPEHRRYYEASIKAYDSALQEMHISFPKGVERIIAVNEFRWRPCMKKHTVSPAPTKGDAKRIAS
eukprot:IDg1706t1